MPIIPAPSPEALEKLDRHHESIRTAFEVLDREERVVEGISIDKAEIAYKARYVGLYDLPTREGPLLVFWTDTPDRSLGHDNYFGLFRHPLTDLIYITSAASIRDATYSAIELADGSFICSRYRHDYQTGPDGEMIDGGLAYIRCAGKGVTHAMKVVDGHEVFTRYQPVLDADFEIGAAPLTNETPHG